MLPASRVLAVSLLALTAFNAAAHAQSLTSRRTALSYTYVYGAGGDTHSGGDNLVRTTPLLFDSQMTTFSEGTSGILPGNQPYAGSAQCALAYQYDIFGTASHFDRIHLQAYSHVVTFVSGLGGGLMQATNPGNETVLNFQLTGTATYRLQGSVTTPQPGSSTGIILQRFDGVTWQYVFWSAFLPGGQGPFDVSGEIPSGEYRFIGDIGLIANGNQGFDASYDADLTLHEYGVCTADYNGDGDIGTDADIEAFFRCLAGDCCAHCRSADFNDDGDIGTDQDIESFFRVLAGGAC